MKTERRKSRRCSTGSKSVQAVAAASKKRFSVRDISGGGLMVEYNPEPNEPVEMETIDIIAMDHDRVYLQKVSCETVYDTLTLMEDRAFSGSALRIRGLKFVELNREQEDALSLLISRCLSSAVSS